MSRENPRAKYRHDEEAMDQVLRDAGMYDDNMSYDEKKNLRDVLNESKEIANLQAFSRETQQPDTTLETKNKAKRQRRKAMRIASNSSEEEEAEEAVPMECDAIPPLITLSTSNSPDMFGSSQDTNMFVKGITSPFKDPDPIVSSESSSEEEPAPQETSKGGGEIFQSDDSDNEGGFVNSQTNILVPVVQQEISLIDENSAQSFASATDELAQVLSPEESSSQKNTYCVKPNMMARFEMERLLKFNILTCINDENEESFYKKILSERQRKKGGPIPFYRDPSIHLTEERRHQLIIMQLENNSKVMAQMLHSQQLKNFDPNSFVKWAAPVKTCSERNITTLDKPGTSSEPKECILLPWGTKPVVLHLDGKAKTTKTFFPSRLQNQVDLEKQDASLPSELKNRSGLTITKTTQPGPSGIKFGVASSTSSYNAPRATIMIPLSDVRKLSHGESSFENSRSDRPQRNVKRRDSMMDVEDDENDVEWSEPSGPGKRKGKNRGRGVADGTRGGGRGRGGKGKGGGGGGNTRAPPPVVGNHGPLILRRGGGNQRGAAGRSGRISANEVQDELHSNSRTPSPLHVALENQPVCPICNQSFPEKYIEAHAANCMAYEGEESQKCCPNCNTIVPVSLMEKHKAKCEQKRRILSHEGGSQPNTAPALAATFISVPGSPTIEDLISEDEKEEEIVAPPPKRRRSSSISKNNDS